MILVGIFLLPVIRDLTSKKERQENHTSIDDLIKQKERWLQISGHSPDSPNLKLWREAFPSESKLLESFLTWGDSELLDQVNCMIEESSLGEKIGKAELHQILVRTSPKMANENQSSLIQSLINAFKEQKDLP